MNFRNSQPFVGTSAFAHKGGMHAHGVARVSASYEHIDPALVGNERRILISELAGQSNILVKTAKYAIDNNKQLGVKLRDMVQDLENQGYEFEAAEASFDILIKKALGVYRPKFERLAYRVETVAGAAVTTEGTVKVCVGGQILHTVSEGDGPVNAADSALLRAAHSKPYPRPSPKSDSSITRCVSSTPGPALPRGCASSSKIAHDLPRRLGCVGVSESIIKKTRLACGR